MPGARKPTRAQIASYLNARVERDGAHLLWTGAVRTFLRDGAEHAVPLANLPGMRNAYARGIAYRLSFPDTPKNERVKQGCFEDRCIEPNHAILTQSAADRVTEELASLPSNHEGPFSLRGLEPVKPLKDVTKKDPDAPAVEMWPDMVGDVPALVPGKYYRCVNCDTVTQVPSGNYRNRALTTHNACGATGQWEPADAPIIH